MVGPGRSTRSLGVRVGGVEVAGDLALARCPLRRRLPPRRAGRRRGRHLPMDGRRALALGVPADVGRGRRLASCLSAPTPVTVTIATGRGTRSVQVGPVPEWIDVELDPDRYDVINNVGSRLSRAGLRRRPWLPGAATPVSTTTGSDVFAWCGAGVLFRPAYLQDVGLFDERFFMYYEDTDLSWRGRAKGWRYRYVPDRPPAPRPRRHERRGLADVQPLRPAEPPRDGHQERTGCATWVACWPGTARSCSPSAGATSSARLLRGRRPVAGAGAEPGSVAGGYVRLLPSTLAARRRIRAAPGRRRPVPPRVVRLRAAVYNRYWRTGAGARRTAPGSPTCWRQRADGDAPRPRTHRHRVVVRSPPDRRSTASTRQVVPDRPGAVTDAGAAFDLFVNVTFMSADAAPHAQEPLRRPLPEPAGAGPVEAAEGRHPRPPDARRDAGRRRVPLRLLRPRPRVARGRGGPRARGTVRVSLPRGDRPVPVTFVFGAGRPEPTDVVIEVRRARPGQRPGRRSACRAPDALQGTAVTVHPRAARVRTTSAPSSCAPTRSCPASTVGPTPATLGVPLRGIRVGRGLAAHARDLVPVGRPPGSRRSGSAPTAHSSPTPCSPPTGSDGGGRPTARCSTHR